MIELDEAKTILGNNLIGPDELKAIDILGLKIPYELNRIPFSKSFLLEKKNDYYLILGTKEFINGNPLTIRNLISVFGKNPDVYEPCFYNQDWYDKESFIDFQLQDEWFFIRKRVFEDSRAIQPDELLLKHSFPSAIKCCYSFFVVWFSRGDVLWKNDFVWCNDKDHNGDRIYVGKYSDVDGVNKNGFSIHRHLSLRTCYGCID